ncbi:MAG TPA: phospholipase D-like domain-containing protein [Solirubrobacterales bacterium]|nr:phospholipase D-like domain-containing protein [Solirubrobacterales bacterium]
MPPVTAPTDVLSLVAYRGDAKTLLAWDLAEDRRERLAGFTIACKPPGKDEYYLWNQLQFEHPDQHAQDPSEPSNSSVNAPFHKFRWLHVPGLDHQGLEPAMGQYTYTVTPRYFDADGSLQELDSDLGTSIEVLVDGFEKDSLQLAFTRGYVQSQAYVHRFGGEARIVRRDADLLYDTSDIVGTNPDGDEFTYAEEYAWLGYTARKVIFALLDEVLTDEELKLDVFAYDLDEPDIMKKLLALAEQGRVRMILDNARLHHDPQNPQPEDEFEAAFKQAAKGEAEIKRGKFSRYAHDKVMVVSDATGATKVLTGSTNFSVSGLYINSNHVLVFNDASTAQRYGDLFDQVWNEGVKAAAFIASASSTEKFSPSDGVTPPRTITFSPHSEETATGLLEGIATAVGAEADQHGAASVLFAVMGLKGSGPVYPALQVLHEEDTVFSYGVSDDPGGIALYAPGHATGVLVTGTPTSSRLPPPFNQVPSIGSYHQIHHKFVICGFNGADPIVYCGSSNLALGGEEENGDNLIEIHDGDVATAFALEALALVDHFQFLDRLAGHGRNSPEPPADKREAAQSAGWFLSPTAKWAQPYFDPQDLHCIDRKLFAAPLAGTPANG